jgi:hypothetical protein
MENGSSATVRRGEGEGRWLSVTNTEKRGEDPIEGFESKATAQIEEIKG